MKYQGGARVECLREVDAFGRRSLRLYYRLSGLFALHLIGRWALHLSGVMPVDWNPESVEFSMFWVTSGIAIAAISADLVVSMFSGKTGRLSFERDISGEADTPAEDRERVAGLLLEAGYRLESISPDGTEMILVPARPLNRVATIVIPDIRRYPHQVAIRSISVEGGNAVRIALTFRLLITDSGESEYVHNLFDYLEGGRDQVQIRRTCGAWMTSALWLAGGSVVTGYVLPMESFFLSGATFLFTLLSLILTIPLCRRVYGTALGLIALALSAGSLLLCLV